KLIAARIATDAGIPMVIANGGHPECLYDILEGKPVGTLFLAHTNEGAK
ncbi:MAG: glutamate 5-kinase, partial [Ruthenibacterium sp.]